MIANSLAVDGGFVIAKTRYVQPRAADLVSNVESLPEERRRILLVRLGSWLRIFDPASLPVCDAHLPRRVLAPNRLGV